MLIGNLHCLHKKDYRILFLFEIGIFSIYILFSIYIFFIFM